MPPTISEESAASGDPADVVASHVAFVNASVAAGMSADDFDPDSLRSYYVDYYLDQIANGGFSQFVYNSRWGSRLLDLIREGLSAVGAARHVALLDRGGALVATLGPSRLARFLDSAYFGENAERDVLVALDDEFAAAVGETDLVYQNAAWLLARPGLRMIPRDAYPAEAARDGV